MTNRCAICGKSDADAELVPARVVRNQVADLVRREEPGWSDGSWICQSDLNRFRTQIVENALQDERGELSSLDQEVVESIRQHELIAANVNDEITERTTRGQRVADRVASFGGSWTFIILFMTVLIVWITINSAALFGKPFDPYPFILLNLVLSCVAAIQAPVIMMAQNRQESKDRLRAEHDYRVNLKAELEIRHLHAKLDSLLTHQWQRLLEIQQLQTDLLEEISERDGRRPPSGA